MKSRLLTILVVSAAMTSVAASAHGIFFAQRSGQLALVYGEGAQDEDMIARLPLVESVAAYDADYKAIPAKPRPAGALVVLDTEQRPTIVTAVFQNGVWSKMAGKPFEKKGLDEMPGAAVSERYLKFGVAIQGPLTKPLPALPGQTLQIVPVGPIPTRLGAPISYRALFDGKPIAGVALVNDMLNDPDAKPVLTKADGVAVLTVRNQGLNVVRATYKGPSDDPKKYLRTDYTATLTFTLAAEAD